MEANECRKKDKTKYKASFFWMGGSVTTLIFITSNTICYKKKNSNNACNFNNLSKILKFVWYFNVNIYIQNNTSVGGSITEKGACSEWLRTLNKYISLLFLFCVQLCMPYFEINKVAYHPQQTGSLNSI